jgi:hypothetical protein
MFKNDKDKEVFVKTLTIGELTDPNSPLTEEEKRTLRRLGYSYLHRVIERKRGEKYKKKIKKLEEDHTDPPLFI